MSSQPPSQQSDSGVALLAKPLAAKALALRRPEVMIYRNVEYAEDGDILFSQQQTETEGGLLWGPSSELCYPTAVSKAFVGEIFRAGVFFRNNASYPLTRMHVRAELISPRLQRQTLGPADGFKVKEFAPYAHYDIRLEARLREPGQYKLNISAHAFDVSDERRTLPLNFHIDVERAFEITELRVHSIPRPVKTKAGADPQRALSVFPEMQQNALVEVTLMNKMTEPLTVTDVRFDCKDLSTAFYTLAPPPAAVSSSDGKPGSVNESIHFRFRFSGGGQDPPEDMHFRPGDRRTFLFELQPKPDSHHLLAAGAQQSAPPPSGGQSSSGSAAAQAMRHVETELGWVKWEWRRANGDGGSDVSEVVKGQRPAIPLDIDVSAQVLPPQEEGGKGKGTRVVKLIVINRSENKKKDVMLVIRPEVLLAAKWHYTGPCYRLLGIVEPRGGDLEVTFPVVPLQAGLLSLPATAFELKDAANPEVMLWPAGGDPFPSSSLGWSPDTGMPLPPPGSPLLGGPKSPTQKSSSTPSFGAASSGAIGSRQGSSLSPIASVSLCQVVV